MKAAIAILLSLTLLISCGRKGDPLPPEPRTVSEILRAN